MGFNKYKNVTEIKAFFIGYQERSDDTPIALFDVSGGELSGSSVSERTLNQQGIAVPPTPNFNDWKRDREQMKDVADSDLNQIFVQAELEKNISRLECAIAEIRRRRTIPYSRARMRLSQEKMYQYLRASK